MGYQKNRLFSFLNITVLSLIFSASMASAGNRDELYEIGVNAYQKKEHVTALKNLYAFYVLNEDDINKNPEFKEKIDKMIASSESILRVSYSSNLSIQTFGNRTRIITNQTGGSFTGTGREIQNLLNNKSIDLDKIQKINHKALTPLSSER